MNFSDLIVAHSQSRHNYDDLNNPIGTLSLEEEDHDDLTVSRCILCLRSSICIMMKHGKKNHRHNLEKLEMRISMSRHTHNLDRSNEDLSKGVATIIS